MNQDLSFFSYKKEMKHEFEDGLNSTRIATYLTRNKIDPIFVSSNSVPTLVGILLDRRGGGVLSKGNHSKCCIDYYFDEHGRHSLVEFSDIEQQYVEIKLRVDHLNAEDSCIPDATRKHCIKLNEDTIPNEMYLKFSETISSLHDLDYSNHISEIPTEVLETNHRKYFIIVLPHIDDNNLELKRALERIITKLGVKYSKRYLKTITTSCINFINNSYV